ncbi:unnamed protein product [Closterium sp. Naga37s-1]|nr:unnamed protein product [Closterium sp. Naga37s-1]
MCDSFATKMFDDCKGLPVPGTGATFGQFLNSKERMLNKSFGAIFSALGYRSTSLEIVPVSSGSGRSGDRGYLLTSRVRRLFQGFSYPTRFRKSSTQSTQSTRLTRPSAQSAHFGTLANPKADDVQAQFGKDKIVIMKIAVLGGTGNVGSKLAQRLCAAGHDVVLTSRNPGDEKTVKALAYVKEGGKGAATAAGVAEAVEGADAVIVATPGYATAEEWSKVVAPFASYAGVVLDASNSLTAWPALEIGVDHRSTSGGEELKKALPNAHVYKAFNTVGAELMVTPTLGGKPVAMLFAGSEDAAAKETATKVISAVGFRPEYVGPLRYARNLESFAELWVHLALKQGWPRDGFAFDIQKA